MRHYIFMRRFSTQAVWGGCENRLLEYFSRVDYEKTHVTIVTTHDLYSSRLKDRNLPVSVKIFPVVPGTPDARFWPRLNFLRSLKPTHIVYVQGAFTDFRLSDFLAGFMAAKGRLFSLEVLGAPLPPARTARKGRHPLRGWGLWWYAAMLKWSLRGWLCKKILVVSQEVKDRLVRYYKYPAGRITPVFFGIDPEKYKSNPQAKPALRQDMAIPIGDRVMISTARLSPEKRIDRLLQAFDAVYRERKDIWLLLVGAGPRQQEWQELAQKMTSAPRIKFLGFQDRIADFLNLSDIFVLPSDNEGLGIGLLEAMAHELICIATRTPGPNEVIRDGQNGFLVEKSVDGLTAALRKALDLTEAEKNKITQAARMTVVDDFRQEERIRFALQLLELPAQ